jgi:hypothetical protein
MREMARDYTGLGVTEIARTACELLGWKRANGRLKDQECRQLLERLRDQGSLSPHADDLPSGAEALGDLIVGETLLSEKNHLGPANHKIRQRIFVGASDEFFSLILCESDSVRTLARHGKALPAEAYPRKTFASLYVRIYETEYLVSIW